MKQFDTNDAVGINDYIISLDLFDQFDEVTIDLLGLNSIDDRRINEVRITIDVLDREVYQSLHHRNFSERIFEFDNYFEQDVKYLSAAILFLRKLLEIDSSLTDLRFEIKDFWVSAIASNEISSFRLNTLVNSDNMPVASVIYEFSLETRLMTSRHHFETKSVIKIDELKEVVSTLTSENESDRKESKINERTLETHLA